MSQIANDLNSLKKEIDVAVKRLDIKEHKESLTQLEEASKDPNLWDDNRRAQDVMRQISSLKAQVEPWEQLIKNVTDLQDLVGMNDDSLVQEIEEQLRQSQHTFDSLKQQLSFSGPYDDHEAIVTIHAGAGGTDAQDWAQMLLRMYTRWAETEGIKPQLIEQSSGDEAGIKSATLQVGAPFAYGKLKGEHGVHRLVRLSPFNSDNLRQTSFAKVDVMPKIDRPDELNLDEKDIKIDVYRAGGHGGQSVNTTDSAVRVTHLPTGITVSIQNERSQIQNKDTALTILRSRLAQLQLEQHKETLNELKGPSQSAEWGNQIRSYVLHPYKQVKDLRTRFESSDPQSVLDGNLQDFINSYLEMNIAN